MKIESFDMFKNLWKKPNKIKMKRVKKVKIHVDSRHKCNWNTLPESELNIQRNNKMKNKIKNMTIYKKKKLVSAY